MQHVIVVDDSREVSRLLKSALLTLDQSLVVLTMPSGEEALLEFSRQKVDLLIADLRLPGMSGVDLVRKVQARSPETHVILMSGIPENKLPASLNQIRYDAFFRKPMPLADFLEVVRSLLKITTPLRRGLERGKNIPYGGLLSGRFKDIAKPQLADWLVGMRQRLGARLVTLVEENGRVIALDGEYPSLEFETEWMPVIITALEKNTATLRQLYPEEIFPAVVILYGQVFDLVASTVGSYDLIIVMNKALSALRLAMALEEISQMRIELTQNLNSLGAGRISTGALDNKEDQSPQRGNIELPGVGGNEAAGKEEFSALLEQSKIPPDLAESEAFWNRLTEKPGIMVVDSPDFLTYDQAQKLGLVPSIDVKPTE